MKFIQYGSLGLALTALTACEALMPPSSQMPSDSSIIETKKEAQLQEGKKYFKGQIQVRLNSSADLNAFVQSAATEQGVVLQLLDQVANRPIYLFQMKSSLDVEGTAEQLTQNSHVEAASPNYQIKLNGFSDPDLRYQWAVSNTGQDAPFALAGKAGADIRLFEEETSGSEDVVVAIVDTGIDYFHEDLSITKEIKGKLHVVGGNLWMNPDEVPMNGKNEDNNGGDFGAYTDDVFGYDFIGRRGDPKDDHGHGTHIAGVIGALRNNYIGMVGMNEKVKMMGVRFLGASGGGDDFSAQQSIYYVIDMKKRFPKKKFIMNCSWGSSGRESRTGDAGDFLRYAFKEAGDNDILSFVAAGNDGLSTRFFESYPANYSTTLPHVVTVAATNNVDQLADFSNYGYDSVQVAAPGVLIYSTLPGNTYDAWSGTSMATPHVTGLAALVWAANPHMTGLEVKERILSTVDELPQLKGYVSSGGRINVARALRGDVNIGIIEGVVEKIPLSVRSPRSDGTQFMDHVSTFKEEGAKEIQICFKDINLSTDMDYIQVYGSDYRVREIISGRWTNVNLADGSSQDLCAAPVPGDTVHVRIYSNAQANGGGFGRRGFETESLKVVRQ